MHNTENHVNFNADQLSAIVEQFPYYHLAQFWLLANHSNTHPELVEKQALKTALFFCNHKWLNHQLSNQSKINSEVHNTIELNIKDTIEHAIDFKNKEEPKEETVIPFEPLHTVDYFASQGIKITEEPISNDKLGTQLKSFTEWLKSMKKIHLQNLQEGDERTDKKIQNIAEISNADTDVVTESMAEVLVKQDKIEKAIEMYQKLSLKNPSKSAYFAAKIQSLKSE